MIHDSFPDFATRDRPLRIGAVSYLNSKPLIEDLADLARDADLILDVPSRLADDLAASELDVALIPSIEVLRDADYEIVSDACVATRGPVLSVKLFSRVPVEQIRTLALDAPVAANRFAETRATQVAAEDVVPHVVCLCHWARYPGH